MTFDNNRVDEVLNDLRELERDVTEMREAVGNRIINDEGTLRRNLEQHIEMAEEIANDNNDN